MNTTSSSASNSTTTDKTSKVWLVALVGIVSAFVSLQPFILAESGGVFSFLLQSQDTEFFITDIPLELVFPGFVFGFALLSPFPLILKRRPSLNEALITVLGSTLIYGVVRVLGFFLTFLSMGIPAVSFSFVGALGAYWVFLIIKKPFGIFSKKYNGRIVLRGALLGFVSGLFFGFNVPSGGTLPDIDSFTNLSVSFSSLYFIWQIGILLALYKTIIEAREEQGAERVATGPTPQTELAPPSPQL